VTFWWSIRVRAVAELSPATAFFKPMNYQAFTNNSLTMMYEGVRGALAADDALVNEHRELPFRVRETHEWKLHAADLEAEMHKRGMTFDPIDWSEDQAKAAL
jgi:hypothetical protein